MSDPIKAFEIAAGMTPGQTGILIGGGLIVGMLLTGGWMWISHYKGLSRGSVAGADLGKYVIRFILLFVIVLFLVRYANYS